MFTWYGSLGFPRSESDPPQVDDDRATSAAWPDRRQAVMQPCVLDELLEDDHPARTIWSVVERLDLSRFESAIVARGGDPGRAATDPRLLVSLWLYAYTRGVGSGRELDRLCGCRDAYRWLCGGVSLNYPTLNDFRVEHAEALDDLFTQVVMRLVQKDVVDIQRISRDGTRVRASAGGGSFRKHATLERGHTSNPCRSRPIHISPRARPRPKNGRRVSASNGSNRR